MGWVMMSERELNRIEVLAQINDGRLNVNDGALLLDLSKRQIYRLLERFREDGASGLQHTHAAIVENKRLGAVLEQIKQEQVEVPPRKHRAGRQRTKYTPTGRKAPGRPGLQTKKPVNS